jgi:ABC-type sugar transport system ATPase subunit
MDEPLTNLMWRCADMRAELKHLHELSTTMMYVTRSDRAMSMGHGSW